GSQVLFSIAAWNSLHLSASDLPLVLVRSFVWSWLLISVHTLSNQATGWASDARDKPHRPIPRGLVSARGAHRRFFVMVALFLAVGALANVFWWTIAVIALIVHHNYLGGDKHWLTRNMYNMTITLFGLLAAWRMAGPITHSGFTWAALCTGYLGII